MAMPVRLFIRASTWRSGNGSSLARTTRPSNVPSAATSGGLVSASAAASSSAQSVPAPGSPAMGAGVDLGVGRVRRASIVRRDGAALQVVVEVVAMERRHDLVRNARGGEALGEPRGGRASCLAGVGEDGDAPDVGRPLPARHAVGRERGPDRDPEDRVRRRARSRCPRRCRDDRRRRPGTAAPRRPPPTPASSCPPAPCPIRRRAGRSGGCRRPAIRRTMRGMATMPGQPRAPS